MNIFIFHRDLRIVDNLGLNALLKKSKNVFLFFIFNKNQKEPKLNPYFSQNAFNYLQKRLSDLNRKVQINFFEATSEKDVFQEIIQNQKIERIYTNKDFTPFAKKRDLELANFCKRKNIEYKSNFNDYLLFKPGSILSNDQTYFKVFTSFYKKSLQNINLIKKPIQTNSFNFLKYENKFSTKVTSCNFDFVVPIKEKDVLQNITLQKNHHKTRDFLFLEKGTSRISAALKFGVISVRKVFWISLNELGLNNSFLRQLIWREFFYHHFILSSLNQDLVFGENIRKEFDNFPWIHDQKHLNFVKWKNSQTKVEIIDAAMNQLNQTGFMHNRARMIVASYLTKDLNAHWKLGEKYFANQLVDYDPIVNNYSWQWVAGPGLDYQNYYRIFAPEIQVAKFDPEQKYIKKYLPKKYQKENINFKETRDLFRERLKKWKNFKII